MHIIGMVSHKGGTGKSTVTAGLAGHWAAEGRNVIVVDADPQSGVSAALGVPDAYSGATIFDVMNGVDPTSALVSVHPNIAMIPGSLALARAEIDFPTKHGWQDILRRRLWEHLDPNGDVDLVLIDSAPGLGVLPFMALRAANDAVVICQQSFLSMRVLPHMLEVAKRAETHVAGIVPTMIDLRTGHNRDAGKQLYDDYSSLLLESIPRRVVVEDAALAGQPIQTFAPRSDVVNAFAHLAKEIHERSSVHFS